MLPCDTTQASQAPVNMCATYHVRFTFKATPAQLLDLRRLHSRSRERLFNCFTSDPTCEPTHFKRDTRPTAFPMNFPWA